MTFGPWINFQYFGKRIMGRAFSLSRFYKFLAKKRLTDEYLGAADLRFSEIPRMTQAIFKALFWTDSRRSERDFGIDD